ncbi:MAG: hydroxymethylglutaryl-CoA synthase family protein [Henriciella sp.]
MVGILKAGVYIPRRRLQRSAIYEANKWFAPGLRGAAKGEKAVANWDEDSITMAVEAGRNCLGNFDRSGVGALSLTSTTLPFSDRLNSGIAKEALNLNDATSSSDATGSRRAATSELIKALDGKTTSLCLAADRRKAKPASPAEMSYGDAGAALLIGEGDMIANYLGGRTVTIDFVDQFRSRSADFDYAWEGRFAKDEGYNKILADAVIEGLSGLGLTGADIDHAAIAVPVRRIPEGIAKKAGIAPEALCDPLTQTIGDAGAAYPILLLSNILETAKPGEKILLASFGQGADVMIFETTDAITAYQATSQVAACLKNGEADENYLRYLFHRGLLDIEKGMRAEMDEKQPGTTLARSRKAVLGLIGGRCAKTGTIQFPKTDISVNPNSRETHTQEDYPLAEKQAKIVTYTADSLTFCPDPPGYYGMIDFEGGGRMVAEFADVKADEVHVGDDMRMVFRIKAVDDRRDFIKYFWKATPVRGHSTSGEA